MSAKTKPGKRSADKRAATVKAAEVSHGSLFAKAVATEHPLFRLSVHGDRAGLYYREQGREVSACGVIAPLGKSTDIEGRNAGIRVAFRNARGMVVTHTIPDAKMLAPEKLHSYLMEIGFPIPTDNGKLRGQVVQQYLHDLMPTTEFVAVLGDGWHKVHYCESGASFRAYGLGDHVYRPKSASVIACRANKSHEHKHVSSKRRAALTEMLKLLAPDHLAVFAVCAASASVLLRPLRSGALMVFFVGKTSLGKTTLLRLIGSLFGLTGIHTWQSTKDGVEAAALTSRDRPFVIDEVGQGDGSMFADAVYRLTNDSGKLRATSTGAPASASRNINVTVSAGEESPLALIRTARREIKGGHLARVLMIPVDQAHGVWTQLGDCRDGADKSATIERLSHESSGAFADLFCSYVVENIQQVIADAPQEMESFVQEIGDASDLEDDRVVDRVLKDFARIAYAGLVARNAKVVPWTAKRIVGAVQHAFGLWLREYRRERPAKNEDVMRQLRLYFQSQRGNQFPPLAEHRAAPPGTLGGYEHTFRGQADSCFLVLPAFFEQIVCNGLDMKLVVSVLTERGLLQLGPRSSPKTQVHMPDAAGINCSFYVIRRAILVD